VARYKIVEMSPRFLPVALESQLVPGSFAHAAHHLVDSLDLSGFDSHYRNDLTGATAHAPSMLLKAVLLAYSQGIISSRSIERACRENVLFMAITGDAKPHFTTIADFVSRSRDAIASVFAQVLAILGKEGLIGREMFAIDGEIAVQGLDRLTLRGREKVDGQWKLYTLVHNIEKLARFRKAA